MAKNIIKLAVSAVGIIAVLVALIIGNVVCGLNFNVITTYFNGFGIDYDSEEYKLAQAEGLKLVYKMEEDGLVLLKNENGALPLAQGERINVFGWAGSNAGFTYQGSGSGEGASMYTVSLMEAFKQTGIEYNEQLAADYAALGYKRENTPDNTDKFDDYFRIIEAEEDFYGEARMAQAREYSDTAVVVLNRRGSEGYDLPKYQMYRTGNDKNMSRIYSAISPLEEVMLDKVTANFDKVILLLNNTNPMELGFIEDDGIDAVITMGMPGSQGTIGLCNVLKGEAVPSGKLVDTYAYDMSTAASFANAGRDGTKTYTDLGSESLWERGNKYTDYVEDIYTGYKWYETAYADGYWDGYASEYGEGYDGVVQFPFGFGLSYTDFEWTFGDVSIPDGDTLEKDGRISVEVYVQNTGDKDGADVVQLYYSAPYTKGGIEKSALCLGAFAKTGRLSPGQGEMLTLEMDVEQMKSYDAYDKNNNGFMGYELEGGEYTLTLRTDAHTLADVKGGPNTFVYEVPNGGYRYEKDTATGSNVVNRFTTYKNPVSGAESKINEPLNDKAHSIDGADEDVKIEYMTRADFKGTFPSEAKPRRAMGRLKDDAHYCRVDPLIDPNDVMPLHDSTETSYMLTDMLGLSYDDPKWDALVSQLSIEEMAQMCAEGGFKTIAIPRIGKPKTLEFDGPSGLNTVVTGPDGGGAINYPCETVLAQTWDWKVAYQYGKSVGNEAAALNVDGWYAPGANMHRSPLGGRNFEYYSEDPYLSGIMCAYTVKGAKEMGLSCFVKHFAVNDSDTGRGGSYRWLTEQAMREIYFKPFEMAVKIGGANGMMTSVDRIGSIRACGSHALLTQVLRGEWGFRGSVITDYYQCPWNTRDDDFIHDVDEQIRAGNDLALNPDGKASWFDDLESATTVIALQKSAKNIMYTYVDTIYTSENAQGLDIGSTITTKDDVFPSWIFLLIGIDVVVVGGCAVWGVFAVRHYLRHMKKRNADAAEDA